MGYVDEGCYMKRKNIWLVSGLVGVVMLCVIVIPVLLPAQPVSPPTATLFVPTAAAIEPINFIEATPRVQESFSDVCAVTDNRYLLEFSRPGLQKDNGPLFAPDQHHSVRRENGQVILYDGDQVQRVLGVGADPFFDLDQLITWSPDSQHVVYVPSVDTPLTLHTVNGDQPPIQLRDTYHPRDYRSWSTDGQLLALEYPLTLWDVDQNKVTYLITQPHLLRDTFWSPQDHWLAYIWRDNASGDHPFFVTLTNAVEIYHFDLAPEVFYGGLVGLWSPDGHTFALQYQSYEDNLVQVRMKVFTIAGTGKELGVGYFAEQATTEPFWSADGRALWGGYGVDGTRFGVFRYLPDEGRLETVTDDLTKLPFYAPNQAYMATFAAADSANVIELIKVADGSRMPFINAPQAGDPDWSPDGKFVASVWATGMGESREVTLSWLAAATGQRVDWRDGFTDIRELRWLNGSEELAYIGSRRGRETVAIINTSTGQNLTLLDGLTHVQELVYDVNTDTVSFWWRMPDGQVGKDSYRRDGVLVYRVLTFDDLARPRQEFWSPDGQIVALKIGPITQEKLVLAYRDGRPPVIVFDNLHGLGDPLWSPDGEWLVFSMAYQRNDPVFLTVANQQGEELWQQTIPLYYLSELDWIPCS